VICRTPEEAFQAGWDAPCEHGIPNPVDCEHCRLKPEEITRLAALLGPSLRAAARAAEQAAAEEPAA
jgi:hypothetical protein